jgi:hypothetical protein
MHILMIDTESDYEVPDLHGPFDTLLEAQQYAERWRARQGLPIEATPENNDEWTEAGWYFGIFEPRKEV